jgi:DNA-binding NarL/FixJ family response regulator
MKEEKTKILIVDDHAILRQGLRRILDAEPDLMVVGEAGTASDALKRAKQLKPDVVIMDISLPDQDGIESMRQIMKGISCRVIVLSVHLEHQVISEAVAAGAAGYLAKDSADQELISAIRTVVHGGTVFSASVSKRLAESQNSPVAGPRPRAIELLTSREREVFLLLAEGKSPTEVANSLFVSRKTVHTHRQHIKEKLGLRTTTELIRFALRKGIIKTV